MDGSGRIYRRVIGCLGLLCALSVVTAADAATRRYPKMPTAQQVGTGGTAVGKGTNTYSIEQEGVDYIPSDYQSSKGTKMPVKTKYDYSIPRTINHAKNWIGKIGKGGAIGLGVSLGIDMMLDHIGAFLDDQGNLVKNKETVQPPTDLWWCQQPNQSNCRSTDTAYNKKRFATPAEYAVAAADALTSGIYTWTVLGVVVTGSTAVVTFDAYRSDLQSHSESTVTIYRYGTCNPPSVLSSTQNGCVVIEPVPLTEADYQLMDAFANAQNSAWLQGLLKDVCAASNNPGGCFAELKELGSQLSGPAQVQGPSKTTSTTSTDPNGFTQQTTTTQNITYNIKYGPNYYDYSKTITTEKTGTDGSSETTTETESPEVTDEEVADEEKPEEDEEVSAVPCAGSLCDGPAYEDMYEPTDKTKEEELDSYSSRIASIPIIQAVSGIFDISASGSCPVWSYVGTADILGFAMDIDLTFDYFCQPWVVQYGPWIQAVMLVLGVYAAIRIALL